MFTKVKEEDYNWDLTNGTSYSGLLVDMSYNDLVKVFGDPTLPSPSGDNKVQKEWVFQDRKGNTFTIYDWKTYSEVTTVERVTVWHVGSKVFAGHFIDWVESKVRPEQVPSLQDSEA